MAEVRETKHIRLEIFTDIRDREFFSANGSVSVYTKSVAQRVKQAASELVGRNTGNRYSGQHPGRRLKNSGSVVRADTGPPDWMVRFSHPAAVIHHEGARRHSIGEPGQKLFNRNVPSVSWGDARFRDVGVVNHPGHKGNRYLSDAARDLGLKVSQTPGGRFNRRGFARIPRGFV